MTRPSSYMSLPARLAMALVLLATIWLVAPGYGAGPGGALPDLSDFKTVETAATTQIRAPAAGPSGRTGYLGVNAGPDRRGKLSVVEVEPDSPAARAGLQPGDLLLKLGSQAVSSPDELRQLLQSHSPGEEVRIAVRRKEKSLEVPVKLGATSRPMSLNGARVTLGIQLGEPNEEQGAPVRRVTPGSPAQAAGIRTGDLVVKVDGAPLAGAATLGDSLADRKPGDTVTLALRRDGKDMELKLQLAADRESDDRTPGGGPRSLWKKDLYRLAAVYIEYPDVKHNAKVAAKDWEDALFSKGFYVNKESVTGQAVYGSLNDYYQEQSCGAFRVEGKVFDWVEVSKKRSDYSQGTTGRGGGSPLLTEALDLLLAREGKEALRDFDGIFFVYAGSRFPTNRGGLYWPHRATVAHQGKRWPYFIVPEGGARMTNISVVCHEFGHMLGLPDLYARPENPGSEGLGNWCVMSNQVGNGRPQHMGPWCKEQLGWLNPAAIDPSVKHKLVLAPIENSPRECFKVLVKPDGSEYLLLENRRKNGFDQSLPAEGLLIWHIVGNRPILEESHGVEGPQGPRVFPSAVPYPSGANNAFTPYTTPSSRSQLGGGLPVYITNVRRLPDGRITFYVGYEFE
jgi:M6 family metalloprotease-like protein